LVIGGLGLAGGAAGALALHSLFKKKKKKDAEEVQEQPQSAQEIVVKLASDKLKDDAKTTLLDWWKGDPSTPGSSHTWLSGLLAPGAAQLAHRSAMFEPYARTAGDPGILAGLLRKAKEMGISVSHAPGNADGYHFGQSAVQLSRPLERTSSGVLAHELGHAKFMGKGVSVPRALGYNLGPAMSSAGALGVLFSKNQDTGRNSAIAGTLGATPMIAEELGASVNGYKMMRALGAARGKSMGAFIGLPSYLAVAGSPALLHQMKARMNGYAPDSAPLSGAHLG
jgi:hypothetical protein